MLNKPKPPSQPTPGSFTTAIDTIFQGRVPDQMLKEHEEKPRTYDQAKNSLWDMVETIRDMARNQGFQYILKPKWLLEREAEKSANLDRF